MNRASRPRAAQPEGGKRLLRRVLLLVLIGLVLGWFGHYRYWRQNLRRFQVVRPGVLYRSGQPSERGMRYLVDKHGIKTVLCLRYEEPRLRQGLFFEIGEPGGDKEKDYAAALGVRYLRWPLANEVYWPWLTPRQFDRFYKLFDDPSNFPLLVHCAEGRHRTGTYAALFRMEYDRWSAEEALTEMYSFQFGPSRPIQEHNLRTYLPRPRPEEEEWAELLSGFREVLGDEPPGDYEQLIGQLRAAKDQPAVGRALGAYLAAERPFGLCLAERLIDTPDDPLVPLAAEAAGRCVDRSGAGLRDWATSAAWIADFGTAQMQEQLLGLLKEGSQSVAVTARYQALVAGVTNRYTPNRIAYLRPLLDDTRQRPEAASASYRYSDTAVARLTSILDRAFLPEVEAPGRAAWDRGAEAAKAWFARHAATEE